MNTKILYLVLIGVVISACAAPTEMPPTPTPLVLATPTFIAAETLISSTLTALPGLETATAPVNSSTPIPAITSTSTSQPGNTNICADPQVAALIDSLKTAMLNSDGLLLASLVSPTSGMDVRWVRYGAVVNYQSSQAKFLFETTYEVDWGAQPGSGEPKVGSFHDVIAPDLVKIFNQTYTLRCNELKYGGASYDVRWPYDKDFYSIYFSGTAANGNMDWHTWVAGIEYVQGKPYLYALTQFFWEP